MAQTYPDNEANSFYASSRAAWRAWLQEHHASAQNVWLILYKKDSGTPTLTYEEAAEEALCFGWVDSKPNKRDADSSYLFMARRKPASNWSKINKDRIEKLTQAGLMAPAGLAVVEHAKKSGKWNALDEVEAGVIPEDLQASLNKNQQAKDFWEAFPRSTKRSILEWIGNAKQPETRAARIAETVHLAAQNIRANQWRQPKKMAHSR
jgi:uncharacterized protein YdeI (YjbR/CyaY-like superfamily)